MINVASISGSGEFSCSQALRVLHAKPRVFQLVSKKQPSYKGFVTIKFGRYPQASKNENALIEWLVLKNDGSKALLISKYALDCQQYHTSRIFGTWETCTLRKWLNGTFISNAFSHEEQAMILSTTTESADTKDRVFLLSRGEAQKYFSSDSTRQCQGTAYCYAQGAYKDRDGNCKWWLRSPVDSGWTAYVSDLGGLENYDREYSCCVDILSLNSSDLKSSTAPKALIKSERSPQTRSKAAVRFFCKGILCMEHKKSELTVVEFCTGFVKEPL